VNVEFQHDGFTKPDKSSRQDAKNSVDTKNPAV
jgi:hypothetical protein